MKSSEWKKEYDKQNPDHKLRVIALNDLLEITDFDDVVKQPCKHEISYCSFELKDKSYKLKQEDLKDLKKFAKSFINGIEMTYWELSNSDREMIDEQWKDKANLCSSDCLRGPIAFT